MKYQTASAKRLVVKLGSSLLVDDHSGQIYQDWLANFLQEIAQRYHSGQEIIIVSSGAVALGRRYLNLKRYALQLEEKQAAAAIGQIKLAHAYQAGLEKHGITASQVLLTLDDSENRERYLNAKNTLETLLKLGVIPVINENDTVATAEIRFGDNDRLASRVAQMVSADTLVLLSDIEGLYTADPHSHPEASLIAEVRELSAEIMNMAGDATSHYGSGGMITKLMAAKIALASGCRMVIAAGKPGFPLTRIDELGKATWFIPEKTPLTAKKNWLAQHLKPKGKLIIDKGAIAALRQGKSLLSVGVVGIEGQFQKGDPICIMNQEGQEIGRGLCNYPAHEAEKIKGQKSSDHNSILGYFSSEEIVHRDDLVLMI